jgi:ribonuclease P/MRP protein subunit POP5
MVRLKHRYLLAHILYPDARDSANPKPFKRLEEAPYTVQFHRPSSDRLDGRLLMKVIRNGVVELFGDYGSGMIAGSLQGMLGSAQDIVLLISDLTVLPSVKYFSPATSTAIIRVSRDHYRLVWAALTFTTRLPKPVDQACVIQVVRVSGTIRKSEEAAIRLARQSIRRAQKQASQGKVPTVSDLADNSQKTAIDDDPDMDDISGFADGIEDDDDQVDDDEDGD